MSPDGMLLSTFKETAIAYGLLESDAEWDTIYLKHPSLFCQNNYGHYLSLSSYLVNLQNPWICEKSIKKSCVMIFPKIFLWTIPCVMVRNKDVDELLRFLGEGPPLKPSSFQQTRVPNSLPMGVNYVDYEPQGTEVIPVYLQTAP